MARLGGSPVGELSNEELLEEYALLERWFGDDYSLVYPDDNDYERSAELEKEILRRMNG